VRVIGVVDLAGGVAVHARHGIRANYRPVGAAAGCAIDGDPIALARAYVDRLGITELYAADLDAIDSRRCDTHASHAPAVESVQGEILTPLATIAPLWLDAGISTLVHAREALTHRSARVVVGLETLDSFDTLSAICEELGGDRVAFSLDLQHGGPLSPRLPGPRFDAARLAERASAAGVGALIVLDLARVGSSTGLDLDTITRVRRAATGTLLLAGGGVRGPEDLARLAEAGCDGALVATALHDGRIGAEDLRRLRHTSDRR
jgi:phosphoribosylformimino-5-aminoimidazole carboxamide ribotide isomerase